MSENDDRDPQRPESLEETTDSYEKDATRQISQDQLKNIRESANLPAFAQLDKEETDDDIPAADDTPTGEVELDPALLGEGEGEETRSVDRSQLDALMGLKHPPGATKGAASEAAEKAASRQRQGTPQAGVIRPAHAGRHSQADEAPVDEPMSADDFGDFSDEDMHAVVFGGDDDAAGPGLPEPPIAAGDEAAPVGSSGDRIGPAADDRSAPPEAWPSLGEPPGPPPAGAEPVFAPAPSPPETTQGEPGGPPPGGAPVPGGDLEPPPNFEQTPVPAAGSRAPAILLALVALACLSGGAMILLADLAPPAVAYAAQGIGGVLLGVAIAMLLRD